MFSQRKALMFASILWSVQVATKFITLLPKQTLAIMMLALLSRVAAMFALLLPVKIILILGHESIPHYFPDVFLNLARNELVIYLCVATIFFYLLHISTEKLIRYIEQTADKQLSLYISSILRSKSSGISIKKAYNRVSSILAELVFFISVMIFIITCYWQLFLLIMMYVVSIMVVCEFYIKKGKRTKIKGNDTIEDEDIVQTFWFDIGFLLSFLFIVYGLLQDSGPSIILTFAAFLLLRRSSGGLKRLFKDIGFLNKQKNNIGFMLFTEPAATSCNDISRLRLSRSELIEFGREALKYTFPDLNSLIVLSVEWVNLELTSISTFKLSTEVRGEKRTFFLKIYWKKNDSRFERELIILEKAPNLPAPELLGSGVIDDLNWILTSWDRFDDIGTENNGIQNLNEVLIKLRPTDTLVKAWQLAYPPLYQKMNEGYWRNLENVIELICPTALDDIVYLKENHSFLAALVKALPSIMTINGSSLASVKIDANGNFVLLDWSGLSVQQLGGGSLNHEGMYKDINLVQTTCWDKAISNDRFIKQKVTLTAMLYELDILLKKQRYQDIVNLLGPLSDKLKAYMKYISCVP